MKNFDLNAYGVSEMNVAEMQMTDGGFLPLIPLGWYVGIAVFELCCCAVALGMNEAMKEH